MSMRLVTFLAICSAASGTCLADTATQDAQSAASGWDAAYNRGDMDTLAKLYAQDAVVVTKGTQKRSGEITEFFAGLKTKGWDEHKTTVNGVLCAHSGHPAAFARISKADILSPA